MGIPRLFSHEDPAWGSRSAASGSAAVPEPPGPARWRRQASGSPAAAAVACRPRGARQLSPLWSGRDTPAAGPWGSLKWEVQSPRSSQSLCLGREPPRSLRAAPAPHTARGRNPQALKIGPGTERGTAPTPNGHTSSPEHGPRTSPACLSWAGGPGTPGNPGKLSSGSAQQAAPRAHIQPQVHAGARGQVLHVPPNDKGNGEDRV